MTLDVDVIKEIKQLNPALKVILLMRDPVERAWSSAVKVLARRKDSPIDAISDADFLAYLDMANIRLRSDYQNALANWEAVFGREQVFTAFFEELQQNPSSLLVRVFRFLNISDNEKYIPKEVTRKISPTGKFRTAVPERFQTHLALQFLPQLRSLSQRFGEPVLTWQKRAEQIIDRNKQV